MCTPMEATIRSFEMKRDMTMKRRGETARIEIGHMAQSTSSHEYKYVNRSRVDDLMKHAHATSVHTQARPEKRSSYIKF